MRTTALTLAAAAASTILLSVPVASGAGTNLVPTTVLDLELNEAPGSTTAVDTSGLDHDGDIGSHIVMSGSDAFIDRHPPGEHIYYGLDHLIMIPDASDGSLDPGTGNFTVEIRYKSKEKFGNVIQKGQAGAQGGQFKMQMPGGRVSCLFRTPTGTATAGSGTTLINDNQYHIIRCERTPTMVTMYIDGVRISRINKPTGNLDNNQPWTIGGKLNCDTAGGDTADSCDYFSGNVDWVHLIGETEDSGDTTPPAVTTTTPAAGATGVARGANLTATFSEPVTGVSATTMTLEKTSTGAPYAGVVSYSASDKKATLNPNVNLPSNTNFTVTLTSGITDDAGNELPPTTWSFTTGS